MSRNSSYFDENLPHKAITIRFSLPPIRKRGSNPLVLKNGPRKSQRNLSVACSKSVFSKIFSRIVGAWHWKSAILSTAPRICQHEDIWPINKGMDVFRLHRPFPLPNPPLDSLRSPIFIFLIWPFLPLRSQVPGKQKSRWITFFISIYQISG